MFPFKHRSINRRHGHRHLLDVKLRSNVVRAARLRWAAALVVVLIGTVAVLGATWFAGVWAVDRFLTGNDAFAIRRIEVQTDGDLALDEIRQRAGVNVGMNLLALDLAKIKRNLERIPNIRMATVERVLPHDLRIRVLEREALAQFRTSLATAASSDSPTLSLDEEGYVVPPLEPRQRSGPATKAPSAHPLIYGIDPGHVPPGQKLDQPALRAALQFIVAFERSPMVGVVDLDQIDISAPEALRVITAQGSEVIFSTQDFDRQLRRWRQIHDFGQQAQRTIGSLDLAVPNNIPVRWLEAATLPMGAPIPVKPIPYRKPNV